MREFNEDLKLEEGEVTCPLCEGSGKERNKEYVCHKCDGSRKVDWVSATTYKPVKSSALRSLQVRKIFIDLEKIAINGFPNLRLIKSSLDNYLYRMKLANIIYDYFINTIDSLERICIFQIFVTPNRSVEMAKLDLKVLKE